MSRVRRKEGPKKHSRISRKQNRKSVFIKPRQIGAVEKLSSKCQAHGARTTFLSSIDAAVEPAIEL